MVENGINIIQVGNHMALTVARLPSTLEFIRFLRDATGHGVRVLWGGWCDPELPLDQLVHLYPPEYTLKGPADGLVERWRQSYRYGLLYWRQGPGFIKIKDARPFPGNPVKVTFGDPRLLSAFGRLEEPVDLAAYHEDWWPSAIDTFHQTHLCFASDGMGIRLPYRMRVWPIPAFSI